MYIQPSLKNNIHDFHYFRRLRMSYLKSILILLAFQFFLSNDNKGENAFNNSVNEMLSVQAAHGKYHEQLHCSHLKKTFGPFARTTKSFQKRKRKSTAGGFCRVSTSFVTIRQLASARTCSQLQSSKIFSFFNLPLHRGPPFIA